MKKSKLLLTDSEVVWLQEVVANNILTDLILDNDSIYLDKRQLINFQKKIQNL